MKKLLTLLTLVAAMLSAPIVGAATPITGALIDTFHMSPGGVVTFAAQIANNSNKPSANLRWELFAFTEPYVGGTQYGYKLFQANSGVSDQLGSRYFLGAYESRTDRISGPYLSPPAGTYYLVLFLLEQLNPAGSADDGYAIGTFRITFTPTKLPITSSIVPEVGLWWNPAESGSGYALGYNHGVLLVTTYSYEATGTPQWYISSGPLTNSVFTGSLDKFVQGQCISCTYKNPVSAGSDGPMTIQFTSPTTGTMTLPGRAPFKIELMPF